MRITVIIPIYKVEKYLHQCVTSVLIQTYEDIEIILVDDGSPDSCPRLCDEYAAKDERIKVIHKPNGGLSDARNFGLREATGEYVVFLDSDDWWAGNNILVEIAKLLEQRPDVLFFDRVTYWDNGAITTPEGFNLSSVNGLDRTESITLLMKNGKFIPSACNKFVRTNILKYNGIEFKKGLVCEDIYWTYEIMPFMNKIMGYDKPFYAYRRRADSISATIGKKNINDLLFIINYWSQKLKQTLYDKECQYQLLGFLNYQYFIALGLICQLPADEQKEFKQRTKELQWLMKYDVNSKTHLAYIAYRLLGGRLFRYLLAYYIKHRKQLKGKV